MKAREGRLGTMALHCIFHQQALCSKCLKFDNVISVVVQCVNQIRSQGTETLSVSRYFFFKKESDSEISDVIYMYFITKVPDLAEARIVSEGKRE